MTPFSEADFIAMQARCKPSPVGASSEGVECEADLQDEIAAYLKGRGWYFVRSRMDRPTTTQLGTTDLIIALPNGKTLWLETKSKTGKLRPEQIGVKMMLEKLGHHWACVRNFEQFLEEVRKVENQPKPSPQSTETTPKSPVA